ncbi:TetR/AcrR family transcriptional regulator [Mesorhizobium sp. 8]|nr:TetR/AcrR family transcriptional regulator [Mesorhizobium sp. 8]
MSERTTERVPGVMAPQRYRRLLATAAGEFAAHGFEQASLNAIIRACGMSKSSFYHYFGSKEALFDRVVEEASAALARDLNAPDPETLAGADFWARVEAFLVQALAASARQDWYADLGRLFYLPDLSAERSAALQRVLAGVADWLGRVLAVGRACGAVRDDLPASLQAELVFALLQAMDRWSLRHMNEFDEAAIAGLAHRQFVAMQRLLATDAAMP